MKKALITIVIVMLAIAVGLGVVEILNYFDEAVDIIERPALIATQEATCRDQLSEYDDEVAARIELAVMLERARHNARLVQVIGPMTIFEDGSFRGPPGVVGCIPYALCDVDNSELWHPQSIFTDPLE